MIKNLMFSMIAGVSYIGCFVEFLCRGIKCVTIACENIAIVKKIKSLPDDGIIPSIREVENILSIVTTTPFRLDEKEIKSGYQKFLDSVNESVMMIYGKCQEFNDGRKITIYHYEELVWLATQNGIFHSQVFICLLLDTVAHEECHYHQTIKDKDDDIMSSFLDNFGFRSYHRYLLRKHEVAARAAGLRAMKRYYRLLTL